MKLSIEQIRDLEEPHEEEDNDSTAEAYHISILADRTSVRQSARLSIYEEAEAALRTSKVITKKEFFAKWG